MKIIFLSDIHANFIALNSIQKEIDSAEFIVCLGDYVGYGKDVNEVIDFIKKRPNCICVLGNHDNYLINGFTRDVNDVVKKGIEYAKSVITKKNINWLKSLPLQKEVEFGGKKILIQHASPNNLLEEYLYPDNPNLEKLFDLNYDLVVFGHTHHPILKQKNGKYILNPGSVGQSRNIKNKICYAKFDANKNDIELMQIEPRGDVGEESLTFTRKNA